MKVYARKPGPRGKRSEGKSDYHICKSILQNELSGLKLVSREALQNACNAKTGSEFSLQLSHWTVDKVYKKGEKREAILQVSGLGKKSGIFVNLFWDGKTDNSFQTQVVSEKVSEDATI